MVNHKISTRSFRGVHVFLFVALLCLNGCAILDFSNLVMGAGSINGATVDVPSEAEDNLYDSGTIDLPVTMAKLDSPDAGAITVSVESGTLSISDSYLMATRNHYATVENFTMTITGTAGAIDLTEVSGVVAYTVSSDGVVDTASQVVVTPDDDGSFVLQISFTGRDEVIFAGITSDLTYISPVLRVIKQTLNDISERTNFVIVTTNTNYLDTSQDILSDGDSYYLSLALDDGTNSFLRRSGTGSSLELLLEDSTEEVRQTAALSADKIAYINSDGELKLSLPSAVSSSISDSDGLSAAISSYISDLETLTSYDSAATRLFFMGSEDALIVSQFGDDFVNTHYLNTSSASDVSIVREEIYDDAKVALASDADLLFVFVKAAGAYQFYSVDVSSGVSSAWSNRTLLDGAPDLLSLDSLDVSRDGSTVALTGVNGDGDDVVRYWTLGTGFVDINDPDTDSNEESNTKVNADGSIVIHCGRISGETTHHLNAYRPLVDSQSYPITDNAYNVCDETPGSTYIDQNGILSFYITPEGSTVAQHGFIDLNTLNF